MVSTYGMLRRRAARVCVLSESRRISGELSILSRMAVALVPARGRRLTSGGRCVDFTPQPSALVRSASPPKSAALAPGLFREAGHRRLTQESGGVVAAYGASLRTGGLAEYRLRPLHANPLVCVRATPAYLGRLVSRLPKGLRDKGRPLVHQWARL